MGGRVGLITSDLFHLYEEHVPRHSKIYFDIIPVFEKVFQDYRDEVRERVYPGAEHTVFMKDEEREKFLQMMKGAERERAAFSRS